MNGISYVALTAHDSFVSTQKSSSRENVAAWQREYIVLSFVHIHEIHQHSSHVELPTFYL